ncbi:putative ankyrin repeat-containing domain, PGG domain, ankyrin repeat-containing domain superfamily [Helianthus debilis subsp. tardiflorus]
MEMAGSSASNVNVSNFVSVRLAGRSNYRIWKAQMLCLIKSQALLHIIDAENLFPGDMMIAQYDQLVKGWIFGTMSDQVLNNFVDFDSARDVWMQLESAFSLPIRDAKGVSSNAVDAYTQKEELKHMLATTVNISNFVSVKLSGHNNYDVWRTQTLCFIESHDLLHVIYSQAHFEISRDPMAIKYDKLVAGWILSTMNEEMFTKFIQYENFPPFLWRMVESAFARPLTTSDREGDSSAHFESPATKDLKFMHASNVNVSNFVSVKLSGHNNYKIWKAQMLCLINSQELLHIIEEKYRVVDKYDHLVRGWILGTMSNQLLQDFTSYDLAESLWTILESTFNPLKSESSDKDPLKSESNKEDPGFLFRREFVRVPEIEDMDNIRLKKELYEAAVEGCWWKAKAIMKIHKNAATQAITENGNTILHVAVEMGHNYFLEKLLELLESDHIETQNSTGRTALHIAAEVGNEYAAQLLVQKRKELLGILDHNGLSALHTAYINTKINMAASLIKSTPPSMSDTYSDNDKQNAFVAAILTRQYDLTETLLKKFPDYAVNHAEILRMITITFPNDLSFMESFIYPGFHNVRQKIVLGGSLLFHSNFLDKFVEDILRVARVGKNSLLGKNSMILFFPIATLYPIYELICLLILMLRVILSMLYFLIWKVMAVIVRPIKSIEKKKKEYQEAKKILCLVCGQMGTLNDGYNEPILDAVRQDAYLVVDEILNMSPATINCKDEEGHNIIQLAVKYRSEKVYNLLHHIIERKDSYRKMKDSAGNNLVHLAGRLAPSSVLARTTGAALQLQRELLWRQEVEKLMLPLEIMQDNVDKETPTMVFTREHQDLLKEGESWLKTTAESCSITAALIVTIVFAAAITVPGGSNQESGIPLFKNETAFTIFALFNAFSLFTATTALLLFLSILTARFSEKDFLVSLPRRLIFGLLTLFLATIGMIVAFGAILFIVFCDQRAWMLAPISGFACLPISVIVTIKLPLLVDLIKSTYFPIFGKQRYHLESYNKISRSNTIFMD